ncbi:hypothetical protein LCGC14_2172580 [marine sediment metagenome]|uniref:Uncharacterized protein n=1 Tax=marine sediment metagenome TaxID=412755 RepID=A0A0F9DPP9_9ZZZZ
MKFTAKKSQCCTMAGKLCYEFESSSEQTMANAILAAYAYGSTSDCRDDDYASIKDGYLHITQCGCDLEPVKIEGPDTIITELLGLDWADLQLDYIA